MKKTLSIALLALVSCMLVPGCSTPEKVVDGSLKTGGDVAQGVADGTGAIVKDVADGTGTVVKGAADTAGGAVTGVTTGETADGIGKTVDNAGKEFFKERNVDVMGNDVQVDMKNNKKIRMEF